MNPGKNARYAHPHLESLEGRLLLNAMGVADFEAAGARPTAPEGYVYELDEPVGAGGITKVRRPRA